MLSLRPVVAAAVHGAVSLRRGAFTPTTALVTIVRAAHLSCTIDVVLGYDRSAVAAQIACVKQPSLLSLVTAGKDN